MRAPAPDSRAAPPPYRKRFFSARTARISPASAPLANGGRRHADRRRHRQSQARVPHPDVALAVAGALAPTRPANREEPPAHLVVDLAEHASSLFDWSDPELTRLTAEVAAADIAVFASPTYKAAYTGMLKAFLDRYGSNGLAGTVAVPVMTGGWPGHLLAVEVHLRPVLVELGATVPARGLYVTEPEFGNLDAAVARWADTAVPLIRRALSFNAAASWEGLTRLLPGKPGGAQPQAGRSWSVSAA